MDHHPVDGDRSGADRLEHDGLQRRNGPWTGQRSDPTYQSQHTVTVVYNPAGKLNYKLVAEDAKYYTAGELSWFTQPVMTLFDENAVATWSVRADRAKLTKDRMLYLYGHVEVNSLTTTSQLEKLRRTTLR